MLFEPPRAGITAIDFDVTGNSIFNEDLLPTATKRVHSRCIGLQDAHFVEDYLAKRPIGARHPVARLPLQISDQLAN